MLASSKGIQDVEKDFESQEAPSSSTEPTQNFSASSFGEPQISISAPPSSIQNSQTQPQTLPPRIVSPTTDTRRDIPPPTQNSAPWEFKKMPEPKRAPPTHPVLDPVHRYCLKCNRVKPPRSHHCRRCGTCVLKMDHHCVSRPKEESVRS